MRLAALLRCLADAQLLAGSAAEASANGPLAPGQLAEAFPEAVRSRDVDHLADDSRKVGPQGLFVAVRGAETDGHAFIGEALQKGASVVLCEEVPEDLPAERREGVVFVHSPDTRKALAEVAAAFYGHPSHRLKVVGVTGTNGKTTTAYLVRHVLSTLGEKAALIGTVETELGAGPERSTLTTPGALRLQQMLKTAVDSGCTAGAMEVSSHALDQDRTRATRFVVGVFTNLTPEHLDYHGTLEAYRAAKKRLFDALPAAGVALYNADDAAGAEVVRDTKARAISFGTAGDVRVEVVANRLDGLRLRIDGADERAFRLVGRFNAYNLAAAYGAARAMGYEQAETLDALVEAPPVPGRFEQMYFPAQASPAEAAAPAGDAPEEGRIVIVDYAHTPDALENVLRAIREVQRENDRGARGTLWCVFGCGGDRDRSKRPVMGQVAERLADRLIVTSDNPRTEAPAAIIDDIRKGLERPGEARFIEDRRAAIREAARCSRAGDVVLIAGKGHETYQIIGTDRHPFDDHKEAKKSFGRSASGEDT